MSKRTKNNSQAPAPTSVLESIGLSPEAVLNDYRMAYRSRQASLIGRREVMAGKAKFGIFGDGKEIAQIALARSFRPGDFRSGYYRDQTLIFALEIHGIQEFFAQLYAHADAAHEPASGGRAMNAHFGSRLLDESGQFKDLMRQPNTASDVSPTGSQMPRLVGLAQASKLYREMDSLQNWSELERFSANGAEIAFGTIGNATCAEGMFWESVNAIGVLRVPAVISIWDDGYGISVANDIQVTKSDISLLLQGFQRDRRTRDGYDVYRVRGWDYVELVRTYAKATETARKEHVPALIHVTELTQPQGHSTSGSHERYKSKSRLDEAEAEDRREVEGIREAAWAAFVADKKSDCEELADRIDEVASAPGADAGALSALSAELRALDDPQREALMIAVRKALVSQHGRSIDEGRLLIEWRDKQLRVNAERYGSHLYDPGDRAALKVPAVAPVYVSNAPSRNGFEIINVCFDEMLARDPRVLAFGEDLGKIGGVNQGFRGLQEKYGELRVSDTGIRETTIIGQAIGLAMRGLRPIAEIQYLDYLLYALQILSDDLATLRWRTAGGQKAPVIVRTRGHRLEGIWHAGSPMSGIISLVRGMHVCVPRDMTRAAGFYNTLLLGEDPGIVIEVLSGYRLKEPLPENIGDMTLPLGVPEILREGEDLTLVTYGACCRIAMAASKVLEGLGIQVEVIDVQTLLPFDIEHRIGASLAKTGRILFVDEDVPGGATAYMLQQVMETQKGYYHLDSEPRTLSAGAHRPAYGSDGDYFSKPNTESIIEAVMELMNEFDPARYPLLGED
jgi:pyruvate/2-oxoglutarate/acetoin dehydrogenase E1 component/TPP-dependent pyruvate/acetoin dehydrogenase alpha subunit